MSERTTERHGERHRERMAERNAQMRALRAEGWTLAAIGRRHALSVKRVSAIVGGPPTLHVVVPRVLGPLARKRWRGPRQQERREA